MQYTATNQVTVTLSNSRVVLRSSVAEVSGRSVDTPGEKYQMDIENLTLEGHVKIVCEVKKCQNGSTKFESANLEACPEGDLPQTTGKHFVFLYSLKLRVVLIIQQVVVSRNPCRF